MKAKSLLGLREKSSLKEIKQRYKNLMKKWHPDKHKDEIEKATKMSAQSEWMRSKFGNKKETI